MYIHIPDIEAAVFDLKEVFLHCKVYEGEGKDKRVRLMEVFDL